MPLILGFLFLVLPLIELAVLIEVGQKIGVLPTIALLVIVSIAGAVLAKREGVAVWRRFQAALQKGDVPSTEVFDGALVLFGAALLLTPGFITDILGLALLLPPSRAAVRRSLIKGGKFMLFKRFPIAAAGNFARNRVKTVKARRVPNSTTEPSEPVDNQ